MNFLETTCTQQYNPTVDYMKNALALIADLGFLYGTPVHNAVKSNLTFDLIKVLLKKPNPDNLSIIDYAKKVLSQAGVNVESNQFIQRVT